MLPLLYRLLTFLGAPLIALYLYRRRRLGKEDPLRFRERFGLASAKRLPGRLVWCHAASVGEAVSLLTLIEALVEKQPDLNILITTGTVTSARMLAGRAPKGVIHQYVPVDRMVYVRRFLDHWRPDFAIWVESDLWPNLLAETRAQMIPTVLVNGQMSDKSFRSWYRAKGWARQILGTFSLILTQTEDIRGRYAALGGKSVRCLGNLKYTGRPLAVSQAELAALQAKIGSRPVWLLAQTHRGEEDIAFAVHKALRATLPDVLTVIVPRHPNRGDEIVKLAATAGLRVARRSTGEPPVPATDIYFADTMGELGLFYSLCPVAVIGGSFAPMGCHNLIEPAQLGVGAIVFGPSVYNCAEIAQEFVHRQAALQLNHANELAFTVQRLLTEPVAARILADNARTLAAEKAHVLPAILAELTPWLAGAVMPAARRRA